MTVFRRKGTTRIYLVSEWQELPGVALISQSGALSLYSIREIIDLMEPLI